MTGAEVVGAEWPDVRATLLAVDEPGTGALNDMVQALAADPPGLAEVDDFLAVWFSRDDLPDSQMAWMLANCFGPDWRTPVLQRLAELTDVGDFSAGGAGDGDDAGALAEAERSRLLSALAEAGPLEGVDPPIIGDGPPPATAAPADLIDLPADPPVGFPSPDPRPDVPGFEWQGEPDERPIRRATQNSGLRDRLRRFPQMLPSFSFRRFGIPRSDTSDPDEAEAAAPSGEDRSEDVFIGGGSAPDDTTDTGDAAEDTAAGEEAATDARRFRATRSELDVRTIDFHYSAVVVAPSLELPLVGDTQLSAAEIGAGLDTHWEVSSAQPLELVDLETNLLVHHDRDGNPVRWFMDFDLHIPASGDSEIRSVLLGPGDPHRVDRPHELDVRVYASSTGDLLRHFELTVSADPAAAPVVHDAFDVAEIVDSIDPPHHEFTTPPDSLDITIFGGQTVKVHGDPIRNRLAHTDHWPTAAELAGPIERVRRHADQLRAKHNAYFEAIDADELTARLAADLASHFLGRTADWSFDDYPDVAVSDEHEAAWQAVASSDEALDLAHHGYELFDTCFRTGTVTRDLVDALPRGSRLGVDWVLGPGNASVPWNLMYVEPPPLSGPIEAGNFLGLRHRLSWTKWRGASSSQVLGDADQAERLHLLYWNDDDIGAESDRQRAAVAALTNHHVVPGPAAETADAGDAAQLTDAQRRDLIAQELVRPTAASVLHFYCHCVHVPGDESKLVFGPANTRNPADFVIEGRRFGAHPFAGQPFVFVNACESSLGDAYEVNQIEQMFFRRGARAFMGTEIKVPIGLASRFAQVFFALLEEPIDDTRLFTGEAAALARRYLWLNYRNIGGLFYSYIHHYGLRMNP